MEPCVGEAQNSGGIAKKLHPKTWLAFLCRIKEYHQVFFTPDGSMSEKDLQGHHRQL